MSAAELRVLFDAAYVDTPEPPDVQLKDLRVTGSDGAPTVAVDVWVEGRLHSTAHAGGDPVAAVAAALTEAGRPMEVLELTGHPVGDHVVAYLEYRCDGRTGWSCARADSVRSAGVAAVVRAAARPA